ncbi:hypothetical protein DM01DRAFT_1339377 [Hesseltinella vesiculosa]|uniref:E3 ubiquitin-protein ligase listerin n=1 Tax=Hesseltinella vesiculosa TaxID=101127 RepID=A0A1X2G6X8_9FUNG|nr:hypothetical protein DM01DRAFT_1339377 [Hesseltinella vesiculosa]
MGKSKQQSKGKSGLKPASSSRAAELAGQSSSLQFGNLGGFAQFANPSLAATISRPSTPGSESGDGVAALDPELTVIVKKVNKRDATTKLKALEELTSYLYNHVSAVGPLLSTWVALYNKLVLEVDRRVRLATVSLHQWIAQNAKKKLAPHLKDIIGAWMITMFDQSKDVAAVAKGSFESVFAEDKRQGVIVFCQKDILEYVGEMLLVKTEDTLSDARYVTPEEMAAKYARVIASCFYVLSYLIEQLPLDECDKAKSEYQNLLDNPTVWNFVTHVSPVIRRSVHRFIKTLLLQWPDAVEARLDVVGPSFFKSVLGEKEASVHAEMWDALLLLTKKFPDAWFTISQKKSPVAKLCTFLRSGLNGSPSIAYPSMLALLANLPVKMKDEKSFFKDVFTNFWAGLSSSYLDVTNARTLVDAYGECLVYFAVNNSSNESLVTYLVDDALNEAIQAFFVHTKKSQPVSEKLVIENGLGLAKYIMILARSAGKIDLYNLWSRLETLWLQPIIDWKASVNSTLGMPDFCCHLGLFFSALYNQSKHTSDEMDSLAGLVERLMEASLESSVVYKDHASTLLSLCRVLLGDYASLVVPHLDLEKHTSLLLSLEPSSSSECLSNLVIVYVQLVESSDDKDLASKVLANLLSKIHGLQDAERKYTCLQALLDNFTPTPLEGLDTLITQAAEALVSPQSFQENCRSLMESVVKTAFKMHSQSKFVSANTFKSVGCMLVHALSAVNRYCYIVNSSFTYASESALLRAAKSSLVVLNDVSSNEVYVTELLSSEEYADYPCQVFDAMFLKETDDKEIIDATATIPIIRQLARSAWQNIQPSLGQAKHTMLDHLRHTIIDVNNMASPLESVQQAKELLRALFGADETSLEYHQAVYVLVGSHGSWLDMYKDFQSFRTLEYQASSVVDMYADMDYRNIYESQDELFPVAYDLYGVSSFGRLVFFTSLLIDQVSVEVFFDLAHGQDVHQRDWIVQMLMVVAQECSRGLGMIGLTRLWKQAEAMDEPLVLAIQSFIQQAHALFDNWLLPVIKLCKADSHQLSRQILAQLSQHDDGSSSRLVQFTAQLLLCPADRADAYHAAFVQTLMDKLVTLDHWSLGQMEPWLAVIKSDARKISQLCKVALMMSFKSVLGESNKYRLLQSDCASRLSGGKGLQIFDDSDSAWEWLTVLNASTLPFGSIAIPPQRLMFLITTIKDWLDQDFDDHLCVTDRHKVQGQIMRLFANISEAVQQVAGSHWNLFLDSATRFLELNESEDRAALPAMYSGLVLLETMFDLSDDGCAEIRDSLDDKWNDIYEVLWKCFLAEKDTELPLSDSLRKYQNLLASLVGRIPSKLVLSGVSYEAVAPLMQACNGIVQTRAYLILQQWIKSQVQQLTLDTEFKTYEQDEEPDHIEPAFVDLLMAVPQLPDWHTSFSEEKKHQVFRYLTTWLLMFDHFDDITFKLKQELTEQLKRIEAVDKFIPTLCDILHIGSSQGTLPFDLSLWDTSIYDMQCFDMSVEASYSLLAAHLYFKALKYIPSLVRTWWVNHKQRQLVIALEQYTRSYFSDELIGNELDLVNRTDVKEQLEDNENEFRVKALKASHEVTASYQVDEQEMRISIKLPSNYPLQQITVDGVQKVGVNEKQWRGWMFAIAAVIGSQNGNLVDALTVFKRNANLHFEGVGDCVICYSIISPQDRSIPTKQCRTCKNKFHASCLYKWFRSSNSTSCPLCRTIFFSE